MTYPIEKQDESVLMSMVQAVAIAPEDARQLVANYEMQVRTAEPSMSEAKIRAKVIDQIISRYALICAAAGGLTALPGAIPGLGTAVNLSTSFADIAASLKFQVDMTMCLTVLINGQMTNAEARDFSVLLALSSSFEQAASGPGTKLASKAGVKMLNMYLKGPVLTTIKELFKKVGITFTKKAATKLIPFGIGALIGTAANYALTNFVGRTVVKVLQIQMEDGLTAA
jgi:hypothetical protein